MNLLDKVPEGHTAEFTHWRVIVGYEQTGPYRLWEIKERGLKISPHGGITRCEIKDAEGNVVSTGVARCRLNDGFCRATGREIALGRALRNLHDPLTPGPMLAEAIHWTENAA